MDNKVLLKAIINKKNKQINLCLPKKKVDKKLIKKIIANKEVLAFLE